MNEPVPEKGFFPPGRVLFDVGDGFLNVEKALPVIPHRGHKGMMAFKLLEMAQQRWRRINGPKLLPLVRAGVKFIDGVQAEHINQQERKDAA